MPYALIPAAGVLTVVLAQLPSGTSSWEEILRSYGYAAPFIFFLLFVVKTLRDDNTKKDSKIDELTTALTDRVIPLVAESNHLNQEAANLIKESQSRVITAGDKLDHNISRLEDLLRKL